MIVVDGVHKKRGPVGNDDLHEEAPQHQQQTFPEILKPEFMRDGQPGQQIFGPLDGAGNQLGEERDKQGIAGDALLSSDFPPVYIHGIAQGLEGVEGNPHRQQHIDARPVQVEAQGHEQGVQAVQGKIKVLEEEKNAQVDNQAGNENQLPQAMLFLRRGAGCVRPVNAQAAEPGDQGGCQQQKGIHCVPAHIKIIAAHQQPDVLGPGRNDVIHHHHNGQENEKLQRVEKHGPVLRMKA